METLKIHKRDKYVICEIANGKVNAIDYQLSKDLYDFFSAANDDEQIEGVILTGPPHCFSAGLDVMKLSSGPGGFPGFWDIHSKALQAMVRFQKPFIAALTGYAIAGGTILACTADYRIMGRGKKHLIGMHEAKLSLVIPDMFVKLFSHWIGDQKAMECFLHSRLMQADEAKEIGLVNEAMEVEDVLPRAEELMQKWTKTYWKATALSKKYFKKGLVEKVNEGLGDDFEEFLKVTSDPMSIQKFMEFQASVKK